MAERDRFAVLGVRIFDLRGQSGAAKALKGSAG
jgi:hypothetical protein